MSEHFCCPNCVSDKAPRHHIFPDPSEQSSGVCNFCGQQSSRLIEAKELSGPFGMLAEIYELAGSGETLSECMKRDWGLFSNLQDFQARNLLCEILDDGNVVRQKFSLKSGNNTQALSQWHELKEELKHRNRWRTDSGIDFERLESSLSYLTVQDLPKTWYRARICRGDVGFKVKEMGAPPRDLSSPGRANPAGIPYLYLGSNQATAISEVRPHPGQRVSVAEFMIAPVSESSLSPKKLSILDLRAPRVTASPFTFSDSAEIEQLWDDLSFLELFSQELTRPVRPTDAVIEYIPSQYICEFIKKCGFNGIIYKSSVGDGENLVLFEPENAKGKKVKDYYIDRVSVSSNPCEE